VIAVTSALWTWQWDVIAVPVAAVLVLPFWPAIRRWIERDL
jgi:hypothetical protein